MLDIFQHFAYRKCQTKANDQISTTSIAHNLTSDHLSAPVASDESSNTLALAVEHYTLLNSTRPSDTTKPLNSGRNITHISTLPPPTTTTTIITDTVLRTTENREQQVDDDGSGLLPSSNAITHLLVSIPTTPNSSTSATAHYDITQHYHHNHRHEVDKSNQHENMQQKTVKLQRFSSDDDAVIDNDSITFDDDDSSFSRVELSEHLNSILCDKLNAVNRQRIRVEVFRFDRTDSGTASVNGQAIDSVYFKDDPKEEESAFEVTTTRWHIVGLPSEAEDGIGYEGSGVGDGDKIDPQVIKTLLG